MSGTGIRISLGRKVVVAVSAFALAVGGIVSAALWQASPARADDPTVDASQSTLTSTDGQSGVCGGISVAPSVTAHIVDGSAASMADVPVTFNILGSSTSAAFDNGLTSTTVNTDQNGDVTVNVTTGLGVGVEVNATVDGDSGPVEISGSPVTVSIPPIAIPSPQTTFALSTSAAKVGDDVTATVTYTAPCGPTAGISVGLTVTDQAGNVVASPTCDTGDDGTCQVAIPTDAPGTFTVALADGFVGPGSPQTLSVSYPESGLILSPATVTSGDPATATVFVVPNMVNPPRYFVVNVIVTDQSSAVVATLSCNTDAGKCSVDLPTRVAAATYNVYATAVDPAGGTPRSVENSPQTLTVVAQPPAPAFDPSQSLLSANTAVTQDICGGFHIGARTVTLKAVDYAGNLMTDLDPLLVKFTGSAPDDTFGPVVNNGDGTYSAEVISAGSWDDVGSVSYDGSADVSAGDGGTTVPLTDMILGPLTHDFVTPVTTITPPPSSVPVGSTSSMTIAYSPDDVALTCAGSVAYFSLQVVGVGRFVDTGDYDISSDGQYAVVTVPVGQPVTVVTTSDNPGVATVNVTAWLGYATGQPRSFDTTFTPAPQFDPSQSLLSSTTTTTYDTCRFNATTAVTALTLTARDTDGQLMTNLDPSLVDFTSSSPGVTFSPVVNNGDGTYTVQVTNAAPSGDTASVSYDGSADVPTASGNTTVQLFMTMTAADIDYGRVIASADQTTVPAGDSATVTATYGTSLAPDPSCVSNARLVQFTVPAGSTLAVVSGTGGPTGTNSDGSTWVQLMTTTTTPASVTVTSATPGTVPVQVGYQSPFMPGMAPATNSPVNITFAPQPVDSWLPTLTVPDSVNLMCALFPVTPSPTASVTVLGPSHVTPVPGVTVKFTATSTAFLNGPETVTVQTDSNGVATMTLSDESPYQLIGGYPVTIDAQVLFTGTAPSTWVETVNSPATMNVVGGCVTPRILDASWAMSTNQANVGDPVTVTTTVINFNNEPLVGWQANFAVTDEATGDVVATPSCTTGDDGTCQANIPTDTAGTYSIAATLTDPSSGVSAPFQNSPQPLTVTAPAPVFDPSQSRLSVDAVWSSNVCGVPTSGVTTLTLMARDTQGNPMKDLDPSLVTFTGSSSDVTFSSPVVNNGDGTYSVRVTYATMGDTASVSYDGSADVTAAGGGTTVAVDEMPPIVDVDWVASATTVTPGAASVAVGDTSTIVFTYAPAKPECAPASVKYGVQIASGIGRIVDTGNYTVSPDGSAAILTVPAGGSVSVPITSDTAGVVGVKVNVPSMNPIVPDQYNITFITYYHPESTLVLSSAQVDAGDPAAATVSVTPNAMNPPSGFDVNFTVTNQSTGVTVATPSCNTGRSGQCSVDLPTLVVGTFEVAAVVVDPVGGTSTPVQNSPQTLTVVAKSPTPGLDPSQSLLSVVTVLPTLDACGTRVIGGTTTVMLTAVDYAGNLMTDLDPLLVKFTGSALNDTFGPVVNNGDGTYSAQAFASGRDDVGSVSYDGSADVSAAGGGTTVPIFTPPALSPRWRDLVTPATTITPPPTSVPVGSTSSMAIAYLPDNPACAEDPAYYDLQVVGGRFVDTGDYQISSDGQYALATVPIGQEVSVVTTSDTPGEVTVNVTARGGPEAPTLPFDTTFTAPLDASQSTLSVSSTWIGYGCASGGYNSDFVATVTAKNSQGDLLANLDPSLMVFAASSTDVAFGKAVNNGDGTYSVPFTLAGEGPYTISAAYDGGSKIADSTGNTDPSVTRGTLNAASVDWVGPATTIKADPTTVTVGQTSTISVTYAPSNLACAPTSATYEFAITNGVGTFGGTGSYTLAAAGPTTELTVPAGKTASVTLTSDTPGTVTVSLSSTSWPPMVNLSASSVSVTFTAPSPTPPSGSMTLSASKVTQGQTVTVSATLSQGNTVGIPVTFKMVNHNTGAVVGTQTCNTNASGTCSVSLPTGVAGVFDISASLQSGGSSVQLMSTPLTLTVDAAPAPAPAPASQSAAPVAASVQTIVVQTGGIPQTSSPWGAAAVTLSVLALGAGLLFRRQVRSSAKAR